MSTKLFVAFGNPLMDTTVKIENTELLDKYCISEDEQIEIDSQRLELLLEDLKQRLQDHPDLLPGRCVCLVRGERRTLVANIGAAGRFDLDFLMNNEELQNSLKQAEIVHTEAFFLSNRFPVCKYLVEEVQKNCGKPLSYNIGATYVIGEFKDESIYMAENADFVYGNRNEYRAIGDLYGVDPEECMLVLHNYRRDLDKTQNQRSAKHGKIIVMTDGSEPVIVVWGRDVVFKKRFPAVKLTPEQIVDTTGAGDAFLAGFTWALMNDLPVEVCAQFACKLAATTIGYVGQVPPPNVEFPTLKDFVEE